jgi:hypothetical protein
MAFEPGGYAEKLGNRYEGRWVVKQFLRLLNEELTYVTIEAVGDDEQSVDLWVMRQDGQRQAQQCKARNRSADRWSVSDLDNRGVLRAMRRQLDRSDSHEFAFVSALPATMLGDICESARRSSGDPEAFFHHQIEEIGENRRKAFQQFCEYLGLDGGQPTGRAAAYEYLRRMHFVLWSDDQNSHDELLTFAGMLATGRPENIVASLAEYAQNNLRRIITCQDVRDHLSTLGFHPMQLAHDVRIAPAVEELYRQFEDSVTPGLIAGKLLHRDETSEIFDGLKADAVVVVHGTAGCGKTGVLYELTKMLREQGFAYIPIRLDRRELGSTALQFGKKLGLPESPALCLESLAGENKAILILDQLDALRWTRAHSAGALDVCKSLVRQIRYLRSSGKAISAVLACRTFDLEHDPEISGWLKESPGANCRRVEVKALPEDTVKSVVEAFGKGFGTMPPQQKRILQSPLHLAMWAELARGGEIDGFQTGVQLMGLFWENRYKELEKAGITVAQADEVIERLVRYMEKKGRVSAPRSLVADRPKEVEAMQSLDILRTTGRRINFCHQSYLDFRIAARLLKEVRLGSGSIRAWLGDKSEQSLFRREQLRQVLSLLIEDSPDDFLMSVRELLAAPDVRFHLKHLILELVGQIEEPDAALFTYLRSLVENGFWKEHIIEVVIVGHPQYIEWLQREAILARWLESKDSRDFGVACWLLRSVAVKIPDFVAEFLEPYAARDEERAKQVLNCLCWNEQDDSDRMFELRLHLARRGIAKDWVNWPQLTAKHPLRAVQLLEAIASTWTTGDTQDIGLGSRPACAVHSHLEQWSDADRKSLMKVAAIHPEYVWEQLMPHIDRLTTVTGEDVHHIQAWQDGKHLHVPKGYTGAARGMVELAAEAGKTLAQRDPMAGLARTRPINNSRSPITQSVLAEVYAALSHAHADETLAWLMADPDRLSLGSGEREPEWMPAVRLISAQSPHCSENTFRRLENWLINNHDPDERKIAEWCLKGWREGVFYDFWGRAQHFLLPALCPHRRLKKTTDLIGVLARKFAGYDQARFLRSGHFIRGWVGSPLPTKGLERVSDKSWLRIINNKKIANEHGHKSKQVGPDALAESSVFTFSRDLARLAKRFPERFGRLALQFPADVHPNYMKAILEGMKESQPKEVPDEEKSAWKPASAELIEAVLAKFNIGEDRELASTFCWLLHDRADEQWSDAIVAKLIHYATEHPNPEPGRLNVWSSETGRDVAHATVDGLVQNILNCVRGVGALAAGALLRHHHEWLERLKPCLDRLVSDPHPVVRTAALEACLPVLNIDRDQAVAWFCAASRGDLRVAASQVGVHFFNCCMQSHEKQLAPVIRRMLTADSEEVVQEGAEEVTARWLFHGMFVEELKACRQGSTPQRKGVAQVASLFLPKSEYLDRCEELLLPLYEDEDVDVRRETGHAFRGQEVFSLPDAPGMVARYIKSKAFADDPSPLLWSLKEFPGSLTPFSEPILMICEVFSSSLRDPSRDMSTRIAGDAHTIPPLLLRLYEQAYGQGETQALQRCLDAWDLLFENRVGATRELMQAIEQ